MLVDVVAVLDVTVPVVEMVDVITVGNLLAVVVHGVCRTVVSVNRCLAMTFPVVKMVDVIAMHDGVMSVARQVLVIVGFPVLVGLPLLVGLGCHVISLGGRPAVDEPRLIRNENHCQ